MEKQINEIFNSKEISRTFGAIMGTILYAIGLNLFIVPIGVYSGGLMGISQIIRTILSEFFNLSFQNFDVAGIIYYIINIPLFLIAYKTMGKTFFARTMICVASMSFFLTVIPVPEEFLLTGDILGSCLIGAIFCGVGIGITLMMGACSGGIDIIGIYLLKTKGNFSIGKANIFVNFFVYAICFLLFDVKIVIYSVIVAAVSSIAMDRIHTQNINVEVIIITRKELSGLEAEVMNKLGRGITKWKTTGAYTKEGSEILYIVLSKYEVNSLKRMVHRHDENAFIVVKEGVWVEGNYLKKL